MFDPTVGNVHLVDGPVWTLDPQHRPPGGDWTSSQTRRDVVLGLEHVNLHLIVGAEDPLPREDFRDIRLSCIFLGGRMIDVPYRPFAVRTSDLMQMPDGIFEARLGTYYMGARILNRWGIPFETSHVVDITPESRAALAARGVEVLDDWTEDELDALGQRRTPEGMVIGPLLPGQARTVYFKVDVANARTEKQAVEFICRNRDGMADPDHIGRKATRHMFISRIDYDVAKNDFVFDAPQGTLRLHVDQVAIDLGELRRAVHRRRDGASAAGEDDHRELRDLLERLLRGEKADLCQIQRLLACACAKGKGKGKGEGRGGGGLDPFYLILTRLRIRVDPKAPYAGQFGEIPYDDPWWKLPLALIAALLALLGGMEEAAQAAYEDEDLVIGRLHDFERHQLDAALCEIDTSREKIYLTVLDAQPGEDNETRVDEDSPGGFVFLSPDVMTRDEIADLLAEAEETGDMAPLRVFKSGTKTGTTIGQIASWVGPWSRCDLAPEEDCDGAPDQITRFDDPDRPTLRFEPLDGADPSIRVNDRGDSGSVWVHFDTKRPIALHHSGNAEANTGTGSLLEYVVERFGITFSGTGS